VDYKRVLGAIPHGHALFDPSEAHSGGCFISLKIFRAITFRIQESKIVTNCKGRFDKKRFWDHTFSHVEFDKSNKYKATLTRRGERNSSRRKI